MGGWTNAKATGCCAGSHCGVNGNFVEITGVGGVSVWGGDTRVVDIYLCTEFEGKGSGKKNPPPGNPRLSGDTVPDIVSSTRGYQTSVILSQTKLKLQNSEPKARPIYIVIRNAHRPRIEVITAGFVRLSCVITVPWIITVTGYGPRRHSPQLLELTPVFPILFTEKKRKNKKNKRTI